MQKQELRMKLISHVKALADLLALSDGEFLDVFIEQSSNETLAQVNKKLLEYTQEQ